MKVVLAYSGGLDTSVILQWLKDTYDCEVVTFTADLRQEGALIVTESTQRGDVGGPEGADAICAGEAAAAGIDGEFKAWLSVTGTPVGDRLTQSTVPYVLPDGTRIADDWNDLVDGSIQAPINVDAMGRARGGGRGRPGAARAGGDGARRRFGRGRRTSGVPTRR